MTTLTLTAPTRGKSLKLIVGLTYILETCDFRRVVTSSLCLVILGLESRTLASSPHPGKLCDHLSSSLCKAKAVAHHSLLGNLVLYQLALAVS